MGNLPLEASLDSRHTKEAVRDDDDDEVGDEEQQVEVLAARGGPLLLLLSGEDGQSPYNYPPHAVATRHAVAF